MLSAEDLARSLRELPALPAVVMDLIESMGKERIGAERFAAKLANDQALTAKTLRLANSSFYGVQRQVVSVQDAITILGMRTVRSVVLAAAVANSFKREWCKDLDFDAFWRHSLGTALCAQELAAFANMESEDAFTVGLLHDIGRLGLSVFSCGAFQEAAAYQAQHGCLMHEAEQAVLGVDHAFIGRRIAEHWRFAPVLIRAIEGHHAPPEEPTPTLCGLVHVADNMSHALGLSRSDSELVPPMNLVVWSSFKIDEESCQCLFKRVESQFDELCQALLM